jgi:hypothetical protein
MNHIILNKKKEKTILFIHGIFSTSGFWLKYLNLFNEFRLIILNIDYLKLSIDEICFYIDSILLDNNYKNYDFIISHSMGSLVSLNYHNRNDSFFFDICPYYISNILDEGEFIRIIHTLNSNKKKIEIKNELYIIENKFGKYKKNKKINKSKIFLPFDDNCFFYKKTNRPYFYEGDHFEVDSAILKISEFINT